MVKKLCIKTFGCQMNVYDSARMADVLAPLGFERTEAPDDADIVILNTCHIREKASEKVFSELGRLRALKHRPRESGGPVLLAVAGCVAQAEGDEILRRAPFVDIVLGPQTYHRLPEMVARVSRGAGSVLDTEFPPEAKFDFLPEITNREGEASAFLTVQEGCDKFCTFCVVPYTRGAEYSRPVADVLAEARRLAASNVVEITLLGQNVNSYHGEAGDGREWGLGRLIRAVAEIPGVSRIRYATSHPADMTDELIEAHRDVGALMPFVHLPVQSGSDAVLASMNRRHTADDYRRVVDRLRGAHPAIALSSDFIVGFPGETDADFQATIDLVEAVGFAQAYSFKYSPRPGTPAAAARQIDDRVKSQRLHALQKVLNAQQRAFNEGCIGRTLPVLFAGQGRMPGQILGRSPFMQAVHAEGPTGLIGTIQSVRITNGWANSVAGVLAEGLAA